MKQFKPVAAVMKVVPAGKNPTILRSTSDFPVPADPVKNTFTPDKTAFTTVFCSTDNCSPSPSMDALWVTAGAVFSDDYNDENGDRRIGIRQLLIRR